jgi:hypothetical protein
MLTEEISSVVAIIDSLREINKSRRTFLCHIFELFLSFSHRLTFHTMGLLGKYNETMYHYHFSKSFNWFRLNVLFVNTFCTKERSQRAIAFDPSFIPKSGKKTPHLGMFWSGVAQKVKRGLEIGGLALLDLEAHTAFHLLAVQTPNTEELKAKGQTLIDHYAQIILKFGKELEKLSDLLVVDGYFAKFKFIEAVLKGTRLHIISRLRDDAALFYLFEGEYQGLGRPKVKDGQVNLKNIDKDRFEFVQEDKEEGTKTWTAVVWSKSLKRKIRIVYLEKLDSKGQYKTHKILFSTLTTLSAIQIIEYYTMRFQIEFIYRDAKQFTALTHCKSRNEKKLDFHFNAALTTINVAKIAHWLSKPKEQRQEFSMATIKNYYGNRLFLKAVFKALDIDPNKQEIKQKIKELYFFGKKAA